MMQQFNETDCFSAYGVSSRVRNNAHMIKTPVKLAIELTSFTGEDIADKLGFSAPHVSRLRNGKSATSTDVISKLAEICGITESEFYRLLGGDDSIRSEITQKLSGTEPDEPILYNQALFDLAVEETRRLDALYANGTAKSKSFSTLMAAIYKFLSSEGTNLDNLETERDRNTSS